MFNEFPVVFSLILVIGKEAERKTTDFILWILWRQRSRERWGAKRKEENDCFLFSSSY